MSLNVRLAVSSSTTMGNASSSTQKRRLRASSRRLRRSPMMVALTPSSGQIKGTRARLSTRLSRTPSVQGVASSSKHHAMATEQSSTKTSCVGICESCRHYLSKAAAALDQIADSEILAERVALAEGLQLLDDLPHVGLNIGGNGGHESGDGLTVLGADDKIDRIRQPFPQFKLLYHSQLDPLGDCRGSNVRGVAMRVPLPSSDQITHFVRAFCFARDLVVGAPRARSHVASVELFGHPAPGEPRRSRNRGATMDDDVAEK